MVSDVSCLLIAWVVTVSSVVIGSISVAGGGFSSLHKAVSASWGMRAVVVSGEEGAGRSECRWAEKHCL